MDMRAMLAPAAALVVWSMVMMIWMFVERLSNFRKYNVDIAKAPPGARGSDLATQMPPGTEWPAHNYAHLMEQPTIFYAACVILSLAGFTGYDVTLAWLYVALRIAHSIWQARYNAVPVRFLIFIAASAMMILLAIRAFFVTVL